MPCSNIGVAVSIPAIDKPSHYRLRDCSILATDSFSDYEVNHSEEVALRRTGRIAGEVEVGFLVSAPREGEVEVLNRLDSVRVVRPDTDLFGLRISGIGEVAHEGTKSSNDNWLTAR